MSWKIVPAVTEAWWPQPPHSSSTPRTGTRAATATTWAAEAIGPSQPDQVCSAGFLSGEVCFELRQIPWIFFDHACILHIGAT